MGASLHLVAVSDLPEIDPLREESPRRPRGPCPFRRPMAEEVNGGEQTVTSADFERLGDDRRAFRVDAESAVAVA